MLARRVYLMNIPYSATSAELEKLCSEFAPVDQVVIPRDKAGLSRGFAFVYLENASDVKTVIEYVDGRHVQGRQVRAKVSLVDNDSKKKSSDRKIPGVQDLDSYVKYIVQLRS